MAHLAGVPESHSFGAEDARRRGAGLETVETASENKSKYFYRGALLSVTYCDLVAVQLLFDREQPERKFPQPYPLDHGGTLRVRGFGVEKARGFSCGNG